MQRYRKIGLAILVLGVIIGSITANMTYKADYYFLADLDMDISKSQLFENLDLPRFACFIAGKRIFQVLIGLLLFRLFVFEACIIGLGFSGAFVFSAFATYQMLKLGLKGMAFLFLSMMPQWMFYLLAIRSFLRSRGEEKKGVYSYIGFFLYFLLGLISEIFINPKWFLFL